jgi:hypothetical protein
MRTEDDIRTACAALERHAPDPDAILRVVRARTPAGPVARRWRRGPWLAAAAAATAAAAITAAAISAAAPGPAGPASVSLAAWSAHVDAGGVVTVTVRELRDLPALQATLRADGVRADVYLRFPDGHPADCPGNVHGRSLLDKIMPVREENNVAIFRIHPDAIPAGDTLVFYFQKVIGVNSVIGPIGVMTTVDTPSGECPG